MVVGNLIGYSKCLKVLSGQLITGFAFPISKLTNLGLGFPMDSFSTRLHFYAKADVETGLFIFCDE